MTSPSCTRTKQPWVGRVHASILVVLFFFEAAAAVAAEHDRPFIERWTRFDEVLQIDQRGPSGFRKRMEVPFAALRSYPGTLSAPPETGPIESVLVISAQQDRAILLVTPKNTMGSMAYLGEEFKQALKRCTADRSWLVTLPENVWTPIELNPYCSMDYDESGILIDLYWTRFSSRPFIDISTNGFSCIAHRLYGWDARAGAYRLKADKCTGSRPQQLYSVNSPMRQVYPPGGEPEGKSGELVPWSVD